MGLSFLSFLVRSILKMVKIKHGDFPLLQELSGFMTLESGLALSVPALEKLCSHDM